ncbi:MAG: hypothetical protein AAB152_02845 [Candidatus Coatesbacteria bacterium]
MIDREAVAAYDRFWQSVPPNELPERVVRTGLRGRARVIVPTEPGPPVGERFDVVIAGGGPWGVLLGNLLAGRGHSILLLERNLTFRCGATWNVSRDELAALRATGVLPEGAWEALVTGEFDEGVFRLYDSAAAPPRQREYHFDEILNLSLDEDRFFAALTKRPGLSIRSGCTARLAAINRSEARVACADGTGERIVAARLYLDTTGWASPLAGIMTRDMDPESVYNMLGIRTATRLPRIANPATGRPLGLICATYENEIPSAAGPVQPILERFTDYVPDRHDGGDLVYYFTRTARPSPLAPLLDDMLARIPQVLDGFREEMAVKTYFGHGPAFHAPGPLARFRRRTSVGDRVLLAGASALQYSGLTGCAFGPLARNAAALAASIDLALRRNRLSFRHLCRIDIDPRERASQAVEGLFGGAMELAPGEAPGTVNRDWIAFAEAAEGLDPELKNEAFQDKIRLKTLNRLVGICAGRPGVVASVLRNNRGRLDLVVWTFVSAYVTLLYHEAMLFLGRRKTKYAVAGGRAVGALPAFAANVGRFYATGRAVKTRMAAGKKGAR